MMIDVSGKNMRTGKAFQEHAQSSLQQVVDKYFHNAIAGHITLEKGLEGFTVKTRVNLTRRMELEATGHDYKDAHAALDAAIEHAEKRLRRHKRRLRNHRAEATDTERTMDLQIASEAVYDSAHSMAEKADNRPEAEAEGDNLPIIAEMNYDIEVMSVEQAVMRLELSTQSSLMFRNSTHLGLNMVYRRTDDTIGWVDPRGNRGLAGA